MAASGNRRASLKGDAEEGRVELELGDETFTHVLTRRGDGVDYSGDPVLDELVDSFHGTAPYIAVALLPEDAQALDGDYRRVTEI